MNTLADQWAAFETKCVPSDAGMLQRIETRRAFYAGALSYAYVVKLIGADSISEDAGVAMLEGLTDELKRFRAELQAGRA